MRNDWGRKGSGWELSYGITYERGDKLLRDSARSLDAAKAKCEARLAKRHNRGETARVYEPGTRAIVFELVRAHKDCPTETR